MYIACASPELLWVQWYMLAFNYQKCSGFELLNIISLISHTCSVYNPGQKDFGQLFFYVARYARFQLLTKFKAPVVSQVINPPLPPSTTMLK